MTKRTKEGEEVGHRIERLLSMAEPKLKWKELDRLAGLTAGHCRQIWQEGWRPEGRTLSAIAGVFAVSMDWLFSGAGKEPTPAAVRAAVTKARAGQGMVQSRRV